MTEKRQEFLESLKNQNTEENERIANLPDRGNVFWNARIQSETIEREKRENERIANLPDRGNAFLAKKVETEYQRRKKLEERE